MAARLRHLIRERRNVGVVGRDRGLPVRLTGPLAAGINAADTDVHPVARHVVPLHIGLLLKPLHRGRRVPGHRENEFRVVMAVTAFKRLKGEEFRRIEDVLLAGGVMRLQLIFHSLLKFSHFLRAGLLIGVLLHDVADRRGHRKELLGFRIHRGHVAFRARRVPADHRHFFKDDHLRAAIHRGRGCHHAGSAAANDDHVGRMHKRLRRGGLLPDRLAVEHRAVRARLHERFADPFPERLRCDRGTRDVIHLRGLTRDHRFRNALHGKRPDPRGFFLIGHADALNLRRAHLHFDRDIAVTALDRRRVGAGRHRGGAPRGKDSGRDDERRDPLQRFRFAEILNGCHFFFSPLVV